MTSFVERLRDTVERVGREDALPDGVCGAYEQLIASGERTLADPAFQAELTRRIEQRSHSVEQVLADAIHAILVEARDGLAEADYHIAVLPAAQQMLTRARDALAASGHLKAASLQHSRVMQLVLLALCADHGAEAEYVDHVMSLDVLQVERSTRALSALAEPAHNAIVPRYH